MSVEDAYADVFDILGYDGGSSHNGKIRRDHKSKSRRSDLYRMFVEWSTSAPPVVVGEKKKVPFSNMLGPLPQELNTGVYKAYGHAGYGQFMRRVVALEEGTMSLEEADNDVFAILGYDGGKMDRDPGYRPFRDASSESHRPDLYRMFVQWSTAPPVVVTPLPEGLRMGVYEAFGSSGLNQLMIRVVALQEGTMSLKEADNAVFDIFGYDQGPNYTLSRTTLTKSYRPDLYRMFVEWSTGEQGVVGKKKKKNNVPFSFGVIKIPTDPPESLCLDSLTDEVLAKDLIALDAALTMSPTMLTALRFGAGGPSVPFSFSAMRELWHKELLKRVSTDTPHK